MKFWDSSALVPLFTDEEHHRTALEWHEEDNEVAVWCLTSLEVLSALWRRHREGKMTIEKVREAYSRFESISEYILVLDDVSRVKERAERLIAVHPLRAADALQLGAALVCFSDHPKGHSFFTFDRRLAGAAEREGFTVPYAEY